MENFNYDEYLKDNLLMKETSGYGNYTKPETMLEQGKEIDFANEFAKGIESLRDTTMYAHMRATESGDTNWTDALDRVASILDQLEDYVDKKSRKLGVIR